MDKSQQRSCATFTTFSDHEHKNLSMPSFSARYTVWQVTRGPLRSLNDGAVRADDLKIRDDHPDAVQWTACGDVLEHARGAWRPGAWQPSGGPASTWPRGTATQEEQPVRAIRVLLTPSRYSMREQLNLFGQQAVALDCCRNESGWILDVALALQLYSSTAV